MEKIIIAKLNITTGLLSGCMIFATIIGAGFASGKEVWYYFARYGGVSYPIVFLMGIIFFVLCFVCLEFGKKFEITAVKQMNSVLFLRFSFIAEMILCLSNFVLLGTMFAGADSLFFESFGASFYRFGGILTAVISIIVVWLGFKRLLRINLVIVPAMIVVVLFVLLNCFVEGNDFEIVHSTVNHNIFFAFLNSISFIVSNLFFAGFIIAKLGYASTTKNNLIASFLGTFFMVVCIFSMLTILYFNSGSFVYDMPLVHVASQQNNVLGFFARIVVWLGIVTTAISLLYQIVNWFESYFGKHKIICIIVCIVAILFSNIGFSKMIDYFYPILGFLGFVFMILMSRRMAKNNCVKRGHYGKL